ncbi:MAG: FG-GAP repeat protein [Actinomycetota bacterium]
MGKSGAVRTMRVAAALALALLISTASPGLARSLIERPSPASRRLPSIVTQTLRTMRELGMPDRLIDRLESRVDVASESDIFAIPVSDLDRDGTREIIEWKLTYSFSFSEGTQGDPLGPEEEFETIFIVRSGDNGKRLWRKSYEDLVFPVDTIGADGRPGIVTIGGLISFFGPSGQRYLDFESLEGRSGKRQWQRSFAGVSAGDAFTQVSENSPISISFAQALAGKPVDIIVSLATEVSTLLTHSVAARVVVVDGSDGSETRHPSVDVGLDWMPYSGAVGDLDGDGLADYAVVNNPGIDLGGPQEPPSVGGTIYARRGTDGSEIWTTSGLELYDFGFAAGIPSVVGDKTREVVLITPNDPEWRDFAVYLFDGGVGLQRWKKLGVGVMVPGDVDRDGRSDLVMADAWFNFEKHKAGFKVSAYRGSGRRIYRKSYRWSFEGLPCPMGYCSSGAGYGWGSGGDIQPDALKETFLLLQAHQDPGEPQTHTILADGRDGAAIHRGDGTTFPAFGAVDGRGDDLFRIETKGGISVVEVLDGRTQRTLLRTVIQRTRGLLPRSAYAFAETFGLPGDRCADIVINMWSGEGSYYAILDGGSGEPLWSRWNGERRSRPRFTSRSDLNTAC